MSTQIKLTKTIYLSDMTLLFVMHYPKISDKLLCFCLFIWFLIFVVLLSCGLWLFGCLLMILRIAPCSALSHSYTVFAYRGAFRTAFMLILWRVKKSANHFCASTCGLWPFDTWIIKNPCRITSAGTNILAVPPWFPWIIIYVSANHIKIHGLSCLRNVQLTSFPT